MPARGAVTLFRIRGIRVGVDYSWFFVLFLIIFWLSSFYRIDPGRAGQRHSARTSLAVASALAFFASILLHELGPRLRRPAHAESASRTSRCGCSAGSRG